MSKPKSVIIAGAGIAGLCAAIALSRQGFKVQIFEKNPVLSEQGAGIQLGPNATAILRHWGLEEALLEKACQPDSIELHDGVKDKILTSLPVRRFAQEHWLAPYVTLHRGDLQKLLLEAIADQPLIALHCGTRVHAVSGCLESGFDIEITNQTDRQHHFADLFLGCDGVWSHLRQTKAEFSGSIAWRATIPLEQGIALASNLFSGENVQVFMGSSGHFITYPIRGGQTCNIVAITNSKVPDNNDKEGLIRAFANWKSPIADIITHVIDWTYWPLFTRDKPCFLDCSDIVFLGDSAHAATPFAAQGAAMAIEDAAVLARFLTPTASFSRQNLTVFALERSKRIAKVVRRGAFNHFVYHASGVVASTRNLYMYARAGEDFLTDLDWLYRFRAFLF